MAHNSSTHTQDVIAVYVSFKEKKEIKETAKKCGKSMTRYLLDLHLKNVKRKKK